MNNEIKTLKNYNLHDFVFKIYVIATFYLGFVMLLVASPILNFFDDAVFLLMILTLILHKPHENHHMKKVILILPLFLFIMVVIAFYHGNSISSVLLSVRQYKNIFLAFLLIGIYNNQFYFVRNVVKWSLIFSLPLAFYQFMFLPNADYVGGVFGYGASGTLSLVSLFYISSEFAIRVRDGNKVFGLYWLLFIPVLLNETKISFILMPLLILYLLFIIGKLSLFKILFLMIFSVVLIFGIDVLYEALYDRKFTDFFSADNMERYFFYDDDEADLGRFLRVIIAYNYISDGGMFTYLFGQGIGASFAGVNSGVYGVAADTFHRTGLNEGSRIQLYHFLIDFGVVGTFLFVSFFIFVITKLRKITKLTDSDIYCASIILIFLVGMTYQNIITNRVTSFLLFFYVYVFFVGWGKVRR